MILKDKFHLIKDQNRRFAKMNFTNLVHTNARFEGINTTLPQTQTIMDGLGVDGVSIDDINTIVQIKRGWEFITNNDSEISLDLEKQINAIVAKNDSLAPGEFRTGQGGVNIGSNELFRPDDVDVDEETKFLDSLLTSGKSATEISLRLMYHNMRNQLFWDGNKRTATLIANKYMIDNGAGLINVPLDLWSKWNELISEFYKTGNVNEILEWTYENAIQGINL
ncbi:Fic family protein [Companilactobacillus alimentarius]|uniref:Filamentation induced by cAMP protein fic n=2 Tax=Companilactobacillus alimentarius TaxID=1602 RepID=A0A2K9HPP2_9LACO|nr:filamentation induced by cAMP protein fic [Companilactobacillus alimentarius DSM 20249]KRK77768.1 hypothetical protein FC67_GL000106 [Companilactobacillus alimentarius DSM 20249]GEO44993.1 hypothetical protein LAL01_12250 [Companilactobacillus alimentarius]